jgi:hypothetical protein
LQSQLCLFEHVTKDHEFKDEELFYRFVDPSHRRSGGDQGKSRQNNSHSTYQSSSNFDSLEELAEKLRKGLLVKDRMFRLKLYRNCVVASEAVDFMVQRGVAATRGDAVVLGRLLASELGLWQHVVDTHKEFEDDHLFFRFNHNTSSSGDAISSSERSTTKSVNSTSYSIEESQRSELPLNGPTNDDVVVRTEVHTVEVLVEIGHQLRQGLKLRTKMYRLNKYLHCFLASEAVDFLLHADLVSSRGEAVQLGNCLSQTELNIWHHLGSHDHLEFQDERVWLYFTDGNDENCSREEASGALPKSSTIGGPWVRKDPQEPSESSVASVSMLSATSTSRTDWTLQQVAEKLRSCLNVKNRRYRMRVFKDCFVASDAVDFMIRLKMASSRKEAVELGQRLEQEHDLWHHVTNDHIFQDQYLFFRFSSGKMRQYHDTDNSSVASSKIAGLHQASELGSDPTQADGAFLQDIAEQLLRGVCVADRAWHLKRYRNVFVGCEAVDFLVQSRLAPGRDEAVELGRRLEEELKLFCHVTKGHAFKDEYKFYRFQASALDDNSDSSASTGKHDGAISSGSNTSRGDNLSLEQIAKLLRKTVQVKTRMYHLQEYRSCFVGSEAVDYLVRGGIAATREEAVGLVRQMASELDFVTHVCGDHVFEDDYLFYRFTSADKGHCDSSINEIEKVIERLQR